MGEIRGREKQQKGWQALNESGMEVLLGMTCVVNEVKIGRWYGET